MAGHIIFEDANCFDLNSVSISELRSVANTHLSEIAADDEQERRNELARQAVLTKYSKPSRKTRSKSRDVQPSVLDAKAPKLRSARDVLDRLRWDPAHKDTRFVVGYLERFEGLKEMPLEAWVGEETDEEWIPLHRIRYFKRADSGKVVWDRDQRVDLVFGSGLGAGLGNRVNEGEQGQ